MVCRFTCPWDLLSWFCFLNDRSLIGHGSASQGLINIHDSPAKDTVVNVHLIGRGSLQDQSRFSSKDVKNIRGPGLRFELYLQPCTFIATDIISRKTIKSSDTRLLGTRLIKNQEFDTFKRESN